MAPPRPLGTKDHQSNSIWSKEKGKGWGSFNGAQEIVVASRLEKGVKGLVPVVGLTPSTQ